MTCTFNLRPWAILGGWWLVLSLGGCGDSNTLALSADGGSGATGTAGRTGSAGRSSEEAGAGGSVASGGASDPGDAGSGGEGTREAGAGGEAGADATAGKSGADATAGKSGADATAGKGGADATAGKGGAGGSDGRAGADGGGKAGTDGAAGTAGSTAPQMIPCNVYAALRVCRDCHGNPPIGGAPMALVTLLDLQSNATSSSSAIAAGTMPAGGSLSSSESELLLDWLNADAPGVSPASCP